MIKFIVIIVSVLTVIRFILCIRSKLYTQNDILFISFGMSLILYGLSIIYNTYIQYTIVICLILLILNYKYIKK